MKNPGYIRITVGQKLTNIHRKNRFKKIILFAIIIFAIILSIFVKKYELLYILTNNIS